MTPTVTKLPSGQYLATNVRVAYPQLAKPVPFQNDPKNTPRYGITVLLPTGSEACNILQKEIQQIAKDKHKVPKLPEADSCLQDGDGKANESYHGNHVLSLYAYPNDNADKGKPSVRNRANTADVPEGDSAYPYSGCYCNVLFDLYTPAKWKKVSGGLKVVQKVADGAVIGKTVDTSVMPSLPDEDFDMDSYEP
jgi:hypothetical protein